MYTYVVALNCDSHRHGVVSNTQGCITDSKLRRLATIGNGVRVGPSRIQDSGSGLFAERPFAATEYITLYDGVVTFLPVTTPADVEQSSHKARVRGTDNVIDGLTTPVDGAGGGSFCNHVTRGVCVIYSVVAVRFNDEMVFAGEHNAQVVTLNCSSRVWVNGEETPIVVVKAIKFIPVGEEILINYGRGTAQRLGLEC